MRRSLLAPVLGLGGLSGISVAFAHAGVSAAGQGMWLAASMLGGLLTAAALAVVGVRMLDLRRRLERIAAGDLSIDSARGSGTGLPFSVLISVALVCQGGAHIALLLAGVGSHTGTIAAPALHIALGFASALIVHAAELLLSRLAGLVEAAHAALRLLLAIAAPCVPGPAAAPRQLLLLGAADGRAPPLIP